MTLVFNYMNTLRLELESLTKEHARELFTAQLNDKMYTFVEEAPILTREGLEQRYASLSKGSPDGCSETWLNWAVKLVSQSLYV